ncbi:hypothetical protein OH717_34075 (plasmid) [Streptomyces albidoflavus]|uniref:hypothetical protein n=1 Tax=Streptomyces albidoflavus TaxID=1886 RepID=UPI002F91114B|nr:hypothetical protein OH717_34245 [Streptomyces albidoflavus]WTD07630.1 hypothetical protein OH717_34075 [Streptomyces albidoflavus]
MSDDPLEQLEAEAAARKRAGRQPGGSRNPRRRKSSSGDAQAKAAAELAARQAEAERRKREAEETEAAAREAEEPAKPDPSPAPEGPARSQGSPDPASGKRPKAIPFYPNPEHDEFLWQVQEAATARREKIPATAVLRLALRRLSEQMTPSEIVRALGGPVQTQGKMGRPRK